MKPTVICHMTASLDGSLHPSRCTTSPDGSRADWSDIYEEVHRAFDADAWLVGRVTMAEMSKAGPHAPERHGPVERPYHLASPRAGRYAIALDPAGKLHFAEGEVNGDHVVVLLGRDVPDSHLAELTADGVSFIVGEADEIDLPAMLDGLGRELGVRRLLLEGGATVNGAFFAAGLVDELSLVVAPILEAGSTSRVSWSSARPGWPARYNSRCRAAPSWRPDWSTCITPSCVAERPGGFLRWRPACR